jgi:hypothetical protein
VKKGRRIVLRRRVPVTASCRFKARIRLTRRRVGKAGRLTVTVRFSGNASLTAKTARTLKLRYG